MSLARNHKSSSPVARRHAARSTTMAAAVVSAGLLAAACAGTGSDLTIDSLGLATQSSGNDTSAIVTGALPAPKPEAAPKRHGKPATETSVALADAAALRQAGRKQQALQRIEEAAQTAADDIDIQKTRAMLALELGQLNKAEKLLRHVVASDPGDWRLHSALGAALSAQGRQQQAQIALAKALELSPENPTVLNNLALSYALASKRKQAEDLLRRVIASNAPKHHLDRARQNLALLLGLNGRMKEAEQLSRSVLTPSMTSANMRILAQGTQPATEDTAPRRSADAATAIKPPVYRLGGPPPDPH